MKLRIFIFYLITLLFTLVLGFGQEQLKIDYKQIAIPQLAPAIAFLVITKLFKVLRTPINIKLDKRIFIRILLALAIPFVLLWFGFYVSVGLNLNFDHNDKVLTTLPSVILGMIFGSLGEEIGWRGFLQPNMEKLTSKIPSAIFVGLLWGLWHIGNYALGVVYMAGFLVFMVSASVILRILLDKTANNLIVAVFFHLSINISFFIFFKDTLTNDKMIWVNGFIWGLTAFLICIDLFRKNKRFLPWFLQMGDSRQT